MKKEFWFLAQPVTFVFCYSVDCHNILVASRKACGSRPACKSCCTSGKLQRLKEQIPISTSLVVTQCHFHSSLTVMKWLLFPGFFCYLKLC